MYIKGDEMRYCVLASGSKGNMTYIETKKSRILIDAGISLREAKKRLDVDYDNVDAILITHAHSDHVSGLVTIAKKADCTVFLTRETFNIIARKYNEKMLDLKVVFIEPNVKFSIKDLNILPLRLSHDSVSCLGFVLVSNKASMGYITDTGFIPIPYISLLKNVDSLVIESNHDIEMLHSSSRPWILKERILSADGHMSNYICGQVLSSILESKKLKSVVLAHLSEEVNNEDIAVSTVIESIKGDYLPEIYVAKQRERLEFIEVTNDN